MFKLLIAIPNREVEGFTGNENRDSVMRTGVRCNENRVFPVEIDLQRVPCEPYRVWVYSIARKETNVPLHKNSYELTVLIYIL